MNTQILCIGGGATRCQNWVRELQQSGYAVVHAANEREAATLLRICAVDVVCIDSQIVAESSGSQIVANLKDASPGVPVVVVQSGNEATENSKERIYVAIDGSTFSGVGPRLIEEFGEVQFPMFVEWFEAWEERTAGEGRDVGPHLLTQPRKTGLYGQMRGDSRW